MSNSTGAVGVPNQPITNLGQLSLIGTVIAGGDSILLYSGSHAYSVGGDNAVNAAAGWDTAEFGVFGYGSNSNGGSEATFNNGSTIVPRTRIDYGDITAPNCVAGGFTGETNNLSFGPAAPIATGPGPALLSTQSSVGGSPTICAAATTVSGTHWPPSCVACGDRFGHCMHVCPHTANPDACETECYNVYDDCLLQHHCPPQ